MKDKLGRFVKGHTPYQHKDNCECSRCTKSFPKRNIFQDGNIPWNKGLTGLKPTFCQPHTEKARKKISDSLKEQYKNGTRTSRRGVKSNKEWCDNISKGLKLSYEEGRRIGGHSEETKEKIKNTLKRKGIKPKQVPWTQERRNATSKRTKERIKKYGHPFKGKHHTKETKDKISKSKLIYYEEMPDNIKELLHKNKKPLKKITCNNCKKTLFTYPKSKKQFCDVKCYTEYKQINGLGIDTIHKLSTATQNTWDSYSKIEREQRLQNILKGLAKNTPSSFEKIMIDIINKHNLPYKYTGDGAFWINKGNPDFVNCNGEKIAIEVYNDFHHPDNYEEIRNKQFSEYGWKTIFIDEREIQNENIILEKIKCVQQS